MAESTCRRFSSEGRALGLTAEARKVTGATSEYPQCAPLAWLLAVEGLFGMDRTCMHGVEQWCTLWGAVRKRSVTVATFRPVV